LQKYNKELLMQITQAMDQAKLTKAHWKIWFLSAMGIFLDGFDLFIIAVGLPLIAHQFKTSPMALGLAGASAPLGCIIGAAFFGRLTDKLGRKTILLIDLMFYVVFAGLSAVSWSIESLIVFRFLLGIGIGADYPVSSTYVTENMPSRLRGKMLVSGFGFQALGALFGAGLGAIVLFLHPSPDAWRWMLGFAVIPAVIILWFRLSLPESPRWLINKGRKDEAAEVASKMVGKKVRASTLSASEETSFKDLFSKRYYKRTLLTAISWFLMDISFYGIGFFTPIILAAMAFSSDGDFIQKDIVATHGAAFLDIFLVIGVFIAIFLVEKWGRIRLQKIGFIGMAIGLFVLAASHYVPSLNHYHLAVIFIGFIIFNITVNMGPNPITYLLPAEVFPTHLRATGHGFASACGKVGAAVGIFLLPVLTAYIGLNATLTFLGITCLLGFLVTKVFGFETKGKSLDELGKVEKEMNVAEVRLLQVQRNIKRLSKDLKATEAALSSALSLLRDNAEFKANKD
jgi:MFS family permease